MISLVAIFKLKLLFHYLLFLTGRFAYLPNCHCCLKTDIIVFQAYFFFLWNVRWVDIRQTGSAIGTLHICGASREPLPNSNLSCYETFLLYCLGKVRTSMSCLQMLTTAVIFFLCKIQLFVFPVLYLPIPEVVEEILEWCSAIKGTLRKKKTLECYLHAMRTYTSALLAGWFASGHQKECSRKWRHLKVDYLLARLQRYHNHRNN